ncbi:MAG: hypothetical protein KDK51_10475 [Deltaproteobacteria bacterium]|nr:hypothetical protein [Deltaproteobacteria bacterium]
MKYVSPSFFLLILSLLVLATIDTARAQESIPEIYHDALDKLFLQKVDQEPFLQNLETNPSLLDGLWMHQYSVARLGDDDAYITFPDLSTDLIISADTEKIELHVYAHDAATDVLHHLEESGVTTEDKMQRFHEMFEDIASQEIASRNPIIKNNSFYYEDLYFGVGAFNQHRCFILRYTDHDALFCVSPLEYIVKDPLMFVDIFLRHNL